MNDEQLQRMRDGDGFIAALDQSGGSSPKALKLYGVDESEYSGEDEMFDRIHQMRTRIMTSPAFNGDRIVAAILFEQTMDRQVEGVPTAEYLWNTKRVIPLLKTDKGLADIENGAQVMKPNPGLAELCARGCDKGIFGTKMRSVIKEANPAGVAAVVTQQFDVANAILSEGLVPIIEPEVDINSPTKAAAEDLLLQELTAGLDSVPDGQQVMFKLTLPETDNLYSSLVGHPKVMRVVALSGGYARDEANARLSRNKGVIASFSRALTEGLNAQQSNDEFNSTLDASIQAIHDASVG